ncbi:MAG: nucleotide sugar dehydrogenase [Candidatus Saganbacteria bacterium]|nr:nucleotide sugar dehydrogenase [Candidatus Saganbacteria bacterium]
MEKLLDKIRSKKANIAIIGMGYVGLPLGIEIAKIGFNVLGIDTSKPKTENLNKGNSHVEDVKSEDIRTLLGQGRISFYDNPQVIEKADVVIICVPTPLRKTGDPDISFITSAVQEIKDHIHENMLVILESTTFPGTTDEVVRPQIESFGYKIGENFFLAFSPERVDPGNPAYYTKNIPKVIGGVEIKSGEAAQALYGQVFEKTMLVKDAKTAEMVKLLENTFRNVNIAFINEFCQICHQMKVDVWEIIETAKTKPFGFMPFYPGPGIGGHCITTDPTYLTWKAKFIGGDVQLINLSTQINREMPAYVVTRVEQLIGDLKDKKILLLGMAYKKDISDIRESPAIDVFRLFRQLGSIADYSDPYVPELHDEVTRESFTSKELSKEMISSYDCVVLTTDHSNYDLKMIEDSAKKIFDTRNAFRGVVSDKIYRL